MNEWIIFIGICIATYFICQAINAHNISRKEIESKRLESKVRHAKLNTVSNIAGSLMGGMLSNSRYYENIKQLQDEVFEHSYSPLMGEEKKDEHARETRLKFAEEALSLASVYHRVCREKYIELAWNIYNEISKEAENRI